jgi:hypothetical protein
MSVRLILGFFRDANNITPKTQLSAIKTLVAGLVIGFESLALGPNGENFQEICKILEEIDGGLLRLLMALAATMTIELKSFDVLRLETVLCASSIQHLLFTLNLDPIMLDSRYFDYLLDRCAVYRSKQVIFEVNEKTTKRYLRRLKECQVDHSLRYCADDLNQWDPQVRDELIERVEMTKVDYMGFQKVMEARCDGPSEAIARLAEHKLPDKPLVVEGVENPSYLRFLHGHWPVASHGHLYGQGYAISPGPPWNRWIRDLKDFGLPGGQILAA